MKDLSALKVLALISCVALAAGCKKRVDPGAAETRESPEGKACPPAVGMISDGESNNNQTNPIQGRGGYWYTFVDKAGSTVTPTAGDQGGTFAMSEGGANGTKYAAHMFGNIGGGDIVYAGMGLNFVDPKGQYDAGKFGGIAFWAKKGPGSASRIRLKVPDVATDPDGKICTACFNDFGMDIDLTEQWQQYTVPFASMKQIKDWGSPHTSGIDKTKIYGIQFQVNEKNAKYDIWVDEIQFTGCQ